MPSEQKKRVPIIQEYFSNIGKSIAQIDEFFNNLVAENERILSFCVNSMAVYRLAITFLSKKYKVFLVQFYNRLCS